MALEDKILTVVSRSAATWDALLAEVGANPSDLDAAIRTLEHAHTITRNRGRFYLAGANPVTQQTATASVDAKPTAKTCRGCKLPKPADKQHFHAHPHAADGLDPYCKDCKRRAAKDRHQKKLGRPASATAPAEARTPSVGPSPAGSPLMILHFNDGVRFGPVVTSDTGLAQMPFHVDLTARQLDELVGWWSEAKKVAA